MLKFNQYLEEKFGDICPECLQDPCVCGGNHIQEAEMTAHKVNVTVSDPNHQAVTQRKEKIAKRVIVKSHTKEGAVEKAKEFYKKKGYKIHDAEHHSIMPSSSMKTEEIQIDESADAALAKKAEASGVSLSILKKVYRRGVAAWNSGHRPGTTPQQWGLARVNSYITKGKGTYHGADKDLREEDLEEAESWEAGYNRRVVKTTKAEHKEKGYNWRIKGKERPEISIKLYKEKPSQAEFNKQMRRVAGHEFGEEAIAEDSRLDNKAYHKGVSDSTAKARVAHWKKMDKLSDRDPRAYEPAPGDATAKTKESKHTKKYRELYGEESQLDEITSDTLQKYRKAAHTQIQHYKFGQGKDKPEASKVLAKREPGMKTATDKVIKKDKERIAALPKREPEKHVPSYPLGGRDEKSGRSYSEEVVTEGAYEKSEENKRSADAAKKQGDMFAHHLHMADYHDNLAQWHSEKGRHGEADKHAEKSEQHHNQAMKLKEEVEQIDELSPETLASYKKKAGEDASVADKKGDFEKGHKRFKGIMRATFKQFAADAKK